MEIFFTEQNLLKQTKGEEGLSITDDSNTTKIPYKVTIYASDQELEVHSPTKKKKAKKKCENNDVERSIVNVDSFDDFQSKLKQNRTPNKISMDQLDDISITLTTSDFEEFENKYNHLRLPKNTSSSVSHSRLIGKNTSIHEYTSECEELNFENESSIEISKPICHGSENEKNMQKAV